MFSQLWVTSAMPSPNQNRLKRLVMVRDRMRAKVARALYWLSRPSDMRVQMNL